MCQLETYHVILTQAKFIETDETQKIKMDSKGKSRELSEQSEFSRDLWNPFFKLYEFHERPMPRR